MEEILKKLQEIQIEAFRRKVASFYVQTYHWEDIEEAPDVIVVRACKTEAGDDIFYGRIYCDNTDEAAATISQLKIYLGI